MTVADAVDAQRIARLGEEEVVGQGAGDRGRQRRAPAEGDRRGDDREHIEQTQAVQGDEALHAEADHRRQSDPGKGEHIAADVQPAALLVRSLPERGVLTINVAQDFQHLCLRNPSFPLQDYGVQA